MNAWVPPTLKEETMLCPTCRRAVKRPRGAETWCANDGHRIPATEINVLVSVDFADATRFARQIHEQLHAPIPPKEPRAL
jgi:hypothetical protein